MFKRVLTNSEKARLKLARETIEAQRFKRPHNARKLHRPKFKSKEEKSIDQTRFHNAEYRSRNVQLIPNLITNSSRSRVIIEPYSRSKEAALINEVFTIKRRREGRYTMLKPPHGFEPVLPDPEIYAEGQPSDLLTVGDRALEIKVKAGEFWKQFWCQASKMVDLMKVDELLDFLEMKEDSGYRHIEFLKKAVRNLVEDVALLNLDQIASVFMVYRHFNSYSYELMETLSRRLVTILDEQIHFHHGLQQEDAHDTSTSDLILFEKKDKNTEKEKTFYPKPISCILRSIIDLRYLHDIHSENRLLPVIAELLISCRPTHDFNAIAEVFSMMGPLQRYLSERETQKLTMRVQLITAVLPERPEFFASSLSLKDRNSHRIEFWKNFAEIQFSSEEGEILQYPKAAKLNPSINLNPEYVGSLIETIAKFSRHHNIEINSDVRDILAFNLASSVQSILSSPEFSNLSPLSPYMAQTPFVYPSCFIRWSDRKPSFFQIYSNFDNVNDYKKVEPNILNEQLNVLKRGIRKHVTLPSRNKRGLNRERKIKNATGSRLPFSYVKELQKELRIGNIRIPESALPYRRLCSKRAYRIAVTRAIKDKLKQQEESKKLKEDTVIWDNESKLFMTTKNGDKVKIYDDTKLKNTTIRVGLSLHEKSQKTINRFATNFVVWQSDEIQKKKRLFEEIFEPAIRGILVLWREMAPIANRARAPLVTGDSSARIPFTTENHIYCDWRDNNLITESLYFIPIYQPTVHEWSTIVAFISSVLRFGPFMLSTDGLCFLLEVIALRAICEASDLGKLQIPKIVCKRRRVSRGSEFFTSANVGRGLSLKEIELRAINMCCNEIIRKWSILKDEQKYRISFFIRTLGFRHHYLQSLVIDDWSSILQGGRKLEQLSKRMRGMA